MGKAEMKTISRDEGETLIQKNEVISSYVDQDEEEMRIILTLSNNSSCTVTYNLINHQKSYSIHDT